MCVHQEHNRDEYYCAIRALGYRYCHILRHTHAKKTLLYAYFSDGFRQDVTDQNIRDIIQWAASGQRNSHKAHQQKLTS